MDQHYPPHPGGLIKRAYLMPNRLKPTNIAAKLQICPSTFNRLINAKTGLSAAMALKLSKVLGRSPESWLAMQRNYDLWKAKNKIDLSQYHPITFLTLSVPELKNSINNFHEEK